jgi:hypothetical protein
MAGSSARFEAVAGVRGFGGAGWETVRGFLFFTVGEAAGLGFAVGAEATGAGGAGSS